MVSSASTNAMDSGIKVSFIQKLVVRWLLEDERHAVVGRELLDAHQSLGPLLVGVCDVHVQCSQLADRAERDPCRPPLPARSRRSHAGGGSITSSTESERDHVAIIAASRRSSSVGRVPPW